MPAPDSTNFYVDWAKERIAEMDAVLASLKAKAGEVQADARAKADRLLAELGKIRDEFRDKAMQEAEAGEAAWRAAMSQLESAWNRFQADVRTYVESFGKQNGQQQRTFQDEAAAQLKAWREAAEKMQGDAAQFQSAVRAGIDAAVKQMKIEASEAEARFRKLSGTSGQPWAVLNSALTESRAAFDRTSQAAWEAYKQAAGQQGAAPRT